MSNEDHKVIGETLTVELLPPITAHCRSCGYEYRNKYGSHPNNCPLCNAEMSHGRASFPYTHVSVSWGRYSLTSDEKQPQYYFYVPSGKRTGFTIDPEYAFDIDGMTPIEVCEELKSVVDKYLYYGRKPEVDALLTELKAREEEDALNFALDEVERLKAELYRAIQNVPDEGDDDE